MISFSLRAIRPSDLATANKIATIPSNGSPSRTAMEAVVAGVACAFAPVEGNRFLTFGSHSGTGMALATGTGRSADVGIKADAGSMVEGLIAFATDWHVGITLAGRASGSPDPS